MKRSKFSLSHYKLLTCNMGELIPLTWYETLPGDTFQHSTSALLRVSPLLSPVMHPVIVRIHHFYVPYRLLWDDFEDFITGGDDGTYTATPPYFSSASISEGSIHDYLGVPPASYSPNLEFSALPARAYQMIWNEHYRDQDLCSAGAISTASGADSTTSTNMENVAWEKDYFTTCRPWDQKGDEVTIPLGESAPITGLGAENQTYADVSQAVYETDGSGTTTYANAMHFDAASANLKMYAEEDPNNTGYPNIRADLSAATGVNISDLRLALALQRYQEARAQYGSRYVEYLRYLGVKSSDARLQGPEYLGGGRQVIQFSEVLSTDGANTGEMKGHGIAAMRTNRYRRFIEEHGLVMSLMSVIPKSIYTQSLHRKFFRQTKEDFFQKELQFIGQQEVYNKEVYADAASPDDVFGYQNRYDEYRNHPSSIAGEMHSTMDHWHYSRIHASEPSLNSTFVTSTPTKRVNADNAADSLYVMANHSIQARRPLSRVARAKTF